MSKIAFSQKAISHNYVTCFQLYLGNWMTNCFHSAAKSEVDIMISGLTQSVQHSGPKIALDFPCPVLYIPWFVCPHLSHAQ